VDLDRDFLHLIRLYQVSYRSTVAKSATTKRPDYDQDP
jgi:hypothetical protein